jgi:hypothetical protein
MKEHHQLYQSNDLELHHSNHHRCTVLHTPTNRDRLSIGGEVAGIGIQCNCELRSIHQQRMEKTCNESIP